MQRSSLGHCEAFLKNKKLVFFLYFAGIMSLNRYYTNLYFRITWFLLRKVIPICCVFRGVGDGLFKIQHTVNLWLGAGTKFRADVSVQTPALNLSLWDLGIFFRF